MKCDNELIVSEALDSIFGFNDSALPVIPSSGLLDVMCSLSTSFQDKQVGCTVYKLIVSICQLY